MDNVEKARDLLEKALKPQTNDPWVHIDRAKDFLDEELREIAEAR